MTNKDMPEVTRILQCLSASNDLNHITVVQTDGEVYTYRRDDTPPQTEVMRAFDLDALREELEEINFNIKTRPVKTEQSIVDQIMRIFAALQSQPAKPCDRHIYGSMADWPRKCMNCGHDESDNSEAIAEIVQAAKPQDVEAIKREMEDFASRFEGAEKHMLRALADHLASKGLLTAAPDAGGE